jgi:hypothetical protein
MPERDIISDLEWLIKHFDEPPELFDALTRARDELRALREIRKDVELRIIHTAGMEYRNLALEEAARICEDYVADDYHISGGRLGKELAAKIRGKKSYE